MAFLKECSVLGDVNKYELSNNIKKYSLRDVGFILTNAGGFLLERSLEPDKGINHSIKFKILVNKSLDGFKMNNVSSSGNSEINIFTHKDADLLIEQYNYQINELIDREILKRIEE
ncbi:MAG: cysteine desulfurase [Firmicutes bacterium]|uniref:Cysteine desulfurase n=1 Tax=Candidatus Gallilactobacillus intestinavium TaxID=2840838 RepID=A0A9D9E508_9LACO|nr:cysteine desulfurase [Candidatus Gallilactobacillus intestinavium]